MADTETPMQSPGKPAAPQEPKAPEVKPLPTRYTLVPFPKVVFFYPLMFIAFACGLMETFDFKMTTETIRHVSASFFLIIFLLNILVISFDFPGVKALALALGLMALCFGVILFDQHVYHILGPLGNLFVTLYWKVEASAAFYFIISAIMFVMIMGGILGNLLWNRWTIEAHRLKHKDGLFSYREYPVIDLQVDKEVDDVFEFLLLGSGTLTFRIPNTPNFRLENVPFIKKAERRIQQIVRKSGDRRD